MKMLPGMTVINPCDFNQTKAATIAIADYEGPVYLRFGRPKWPNFTKEDGSDFVIGKAQVLAEGSDVSIFACGHLVWKAIEAARQPFLDELAATATHLRGRVVETKERFVEEHRSRQPSVFSVLRELVSLFSSGLDPHLGLYGAFGYDLCFQFEPVPLRHARPSDQRDLVLYLPDTLVVVDRQKERASRLLYDFEFDGKHSHGIARSGTSKVYAAARQCFGPSRRARHNGPASSCSMQQRQFCPHPLRRTASGANHTRSP
jgi:anthranilate/para-aminobenzoate synthase component I